MRARHALTFDLEDWHQHGWRHVCGESRPPSRAVSRDTYRILDLLDEVDIRATFFVVGLLAEGCPELVREVARRGHEIGTHSHAHHLVHTMDREAFRRDAERGKKHLEDLTGAAVLGFRAPEFSIRSLDHWAFEVLADLGIAYDSSVFPASFVRYGLRSAPRHPFTIATEHGPVHEFPLATWRIGRSQLAVAGGSYFRLFPRWVLRSALEAIDKEGLSAVLYFHPYEFHDGWLSLPGLGLRSALHQGYLKAVLLHNFKTSAIVSHLRALVGPYRWARLQDLYVDRMSHAIRREANGTERRQS